MNQKSKKRSGHWIDRLTFRIIENWPSLTDFNCNCGISVSGQQHVGRLRGEIILTNAVATELKSRGYEATHYLTLYTSDPWKGKKAQLNAFSDGIEAEKYINWRLIDIPAPVNPEMSWVDYYWKDFGDYLPRFARNIKIIRTHELYQQEKMKQIVIEIIKKKDQIREILNKYRKENPFPEDWVPINPICEHCNRIGTTKALDVNLDTYQVYYFCDECQSDGWSDISKGKLTWRLEWLAIWYFLGVHFEPYGKDHATPGGSRDSCIEILEKILKQKGPNGFWNEWVGYSEGSIDHGDMTSSGFIGFTPKKWLEYAEPEVLKYMYLKTPPKRRIVLGLDKIPSYVGVYDRAERIYHGLEEFEDSTELRAIKRSYEIIFYNEVPKYRGFQLDYNHAIILSQLVSPDDMGIKEAIVKLIATEILNSKPSKEITEYIQMRLTYARNWLNSQYAPAHLRIKLKEHISPEVLKQYDQKIRNIVFKLGNILNKAKWTEKDIKEKMVTLREEQGLSRKEMKQFFQLLYQIFVGNTMGPRFAPFIASLDKQWVIKKLQDIRDV